MIDEDKLRKTEKLENFVEQGFYTSFHYYHKKPSLRQYDVLPEVKSFSKVCTKRQ